MKNQSQINCPNCGTSIDVQDILAHQLEEEIKQKFQSQLAEEKKKYETEFESLNKAKVEFEQKNQRFSTHMDREIQGRYKRQNAHAL